MSVKLRKRKLSDGTYTLILDCYDFHKKRVRESLNLRLTGDKVKDKEIMQIAQTIRLKRELELATTDHELPSLAKRKINFISFFESLIAEKNPSTAKTWTNTLNYLKEYAGDILSFSNVTTEWLTDFQKFLLKKVSANSADIYFSKVKAAIHQAIIKEGIIVKNPCDALTPIKKVATHRAFLTIEELTKMATTSCRSDMLKKAFLFACYTGLRRSDIEKLTWGEIEGNRIIYRQKKTKSAEYLPLSAAAISLLGERRGKNELVFHDLPKRATIDKYITLWGKESGLSKHVTFHVSRHTFATLALTYGADLYTVSKLLGHTDIKTTQIYTKIVDEKKTEAVNLLPAITIS